MWPTRATHRQAADSPSSRGFFVSEIPSELIAAYEGTCFLVHGAQDIELWIGRPSDALSGLLSDNGLSSWAFITADNPYSQGLSASENARRHHALVADVVSLGLRYLPGQGVGSDPSWAPEQSLLVLGISREAATELGRRHGQNAIVFGEGPVPELLLLR